MEQNNLKEIAALSVEDIAAMTELQVVNVFVNLPGKHVETVLLRTPKERVVAMLMCVFSALRERN